MSTAESTPYVSEAERLVFHSFLTLSAILTPTSCKKTHLRCHVNLVGMRLWVANCWFWIWMSGPFKRLQHK